MTIKAQIEDPHATILDAYRRGFSAHDLAAATAALLLIDDARRCGLIDGGPEVDRERCEQVLTELATDGVTVEVDQAAAKAVEMLAEIGVVRP